MTVRRVFFALVLGAGIGGPAAATQISPYAGEETRAIKALSQADVDALLKGEGFGFAKAAELNGVPGPAHLLEMADEIHLSPEQRAQITALFDAMNAQARDLGARLVDLERNLDTAFAAGDVTPAHLTALVSAIAAVEGELRLVHLKTHLETPAILRPHQLVRYNELRGYGSGGGTDHDKGKSHAH